MIRGAVEKNEERVASRVTMSSAAEAIMEARLSNMTKAVREAKLSRQVERVSEARTSVIVLNERFET